MELKKSFLEKYRKLFPNHFTEFVEGFSLPRSYGLRINTLKCQSIKGNKYLENILKPNPLVENGYYYDKDAEPGKHPYHHAGLYYIQDPSAMMVIENADIRTDDVVFDMCAAPGGKSTHILSKLNNTGLLIANEINEKRAKILSENIERMGAKNALVISVDPLDLNEEFNGFFDKVIIDAPCSGEGMFRKDEEAIQDWSQDKVNSCSMIQKKLISKAYDLVKENGLIIYSTCTFSPEENEEVIAYLLSKYTDLELLPTIKTPQIEDGLGQLKECSRFYFHKFNGEGHFIAKIKKLGKSSPIKKTKSLSLKPISKAEKEIVNQFVIEFLENFPLNFPIYNFNNHLYSLFYDGILPNLDYISLKRFGLHLGEIKKGRFEPSHALALTLKPEQVKNVINFSSESIEIMKYLRGETINYKGNTHYNLITVDNYSLAWGKLVDGVIKNNVPKGLRIIK